MSRWSSPVLVPLGAAKLSQGGACARLGTESNYFHYNANGMTTVKVYGPS